MKNQKGFTQMPRFIILIVGVLILSSVGYFGVNQYQNYQTEKIEKERQTQEQKSALEKAQIEIEKLKIESTVTKQNQQALEKTLKNENQKPQVQNISVISSVELSGYLTGIVRLVCWTNNSNGTIKDKVSGSGSLWSFNDITRRYVLTNKHVAIGSQCIINADDSSGKLINMFEGKVVVDFIQNDKDFALLEISDIEDNGFSNIESTKLNYKISSLKFCPTQIEIGSPVVIIGYPASTQTESSVFLSGTESQTVLNTPRTVTSGIISAFDNTSNNLYIGGLSQYQNYFISAKIDSGNSGGISFSKNKNGLCILGIPTWLNIGNYDTQGLIQNINNVIKRN